MRKSVLCRYGMPALCLLMLTSTVTWAQSPAKADAVINPKYVAEHTFPGVITGFFTLLEYVKLAP